MSVSERAIIRDEVKKMDPHAQVYLFGSRVDDSKAGGDIDLLIISEHIEFSKKLDLLIAIKAVLGDQKIDMKILKPTKKDSDPFYESIKGQLQEV